jgi:lysophospholipase L1-like esterase
MRLNLVIILSILMLTACKKEQPDKLVVYNDGFQGYDAYGLIGKEPYLLNQKPNFVILMIGSNDVVNPVELPDYTTNVTQIINTIKERGADVMLLTPPPMDTVIRKAANQKLDSLCLIIRQISVQQQCYFLDVNQLFKQNNYEAGLLLSDGLHPSAAGYQLLCTNLFAYYQQQKLNPKQVICCFGDSITYGQSVPGEGTTNGDTYPAVLKTLLSSI